MKKFYFVFAALLLSSAISAQGRKGDPTLTEIWNPEPKVVAPGKTSQDAPADATVLFNGKDFSAWTGKGGKQIEWTIADGAMTVKGGTGEITSKQGFGDCQLHIEWRTPSVVKGAGQGRGNSGIFLMGKYELQVLDSYNNKTYSNGQAGSIYKQLVPLVNASKAPGEWQTYDIIFTAPRFAADGRLQSQARITVIHNGVLIQNNQAIWGGTEFIGIAEYKPHSMKEPLVLQDHGDAVSFRNIWIREL
jgi:hypothetical protein